MSPFHIGQAREEEGRGSGAQSDFNLRERERERDPACRSSHVETKQMPEVSGSGSLMECATFQAGRDGMGNLYLAIVGVRAKFLHWFWDNTFLCFRK